MKRSFAPSQRKINAAFNPPSQIANHKVQQCQVTLSPEPGSALMPRDIRHFNVVWCKMSSRKHKKWEGDAILTVKPTSRLAILKDVDGTELGRGTSLPLSTLSGLESGSTLSFSGKEIEIMSEIGPDDIQQLQKTAIEEKARVKTEEVSSTKVNPIMPRAPYKRPFASGTKFTQFVSPGAKEVSSSLTLSPDSVVMPRPPTGFYDESTTTIVDVVVDPYLSRQLRNHQRDGVLFLYECLLGFRTPNSYGAILADEMGLGKTLQAITLIWTLLRQGPTGRPVIRRALILAPSSLVKNWQKEFEKWLGRERIDVYAVDQGSKLGEYVKNPRQPVLIMSYEMFIRSSEMVENIDIDLIVCDEGHRLKNNQVKASQCINQMSLDRRLVLTGTPLQNDLKEFYAIVNLVSPGCLGSANSFARNFEDPIVRSKQPEASSAEIELGEEKMEELSHLTSQFILRRTQEIISKYLPPKVEFILFCPPSSAQAYVYENMVERLDSELANFFSDTKCILANIMKLRKVCNHPCLILEDKENGDEPIRLPEELNDLTYEEQGSKLGFVSALLWNLRQVGTEKIVLVSISTQVLDLLQALCEHYDYPFLRLDGSTSSGQRQQVVSRFNNPHCNDFVLLLSSKAGGTGLNLIGASRILLFDMDWNPAHDIQAMSRVWRDGQKRKVFIYRLVTSCTIEEKIFQRQLTKQGLGGGILDPEKSGASQKFHFSEDELKDLFSFTLDLSGCHTHKLLDCDCSGDGTNTFQNEDHSKDSSSRSCQLSLPSSSVIRQGGNGGGGQMQNLRQWKHIDPAVENVLSDDPVLQQCAPYLSFVFKKET